MTAPVIDPRTAGWSWADLGITEAEAQAIPVSAEVEEYSARKAAPALRGLVSNPGVTALQRIAAELVAMGVQVRYVDGWGTRGYLPLRPAGLINHWIVSTYRPGLVAPTLGLIVNGHSTLAGPLANLVLGFDGTVYIVAALSANHGGVGSWRGVSGNDRWLGVECEGGPVLQPAQIAALPKLNAAVARALPVDPAAWCIGHHEYAPTRKVDIGGYMTPARIEAVRIVRGETPRPLDPSPPTTPPVLEDDMIMISAPGRGQALIGPGYHYWLPTPEFVAEVAPLVTKVVEGNDRQFDIWVAAATQGGYDLDRATKARVDQILAEVEKGSQ